MDDITQTIASESKLTPNQTVYVQVSGDKDAGRADATKYAGVMYENGGVNYGINVDGSSTIVNLSAEDSTAISSDLVDIEGSGIGVDVANMDASDKSVSNAGVEALDSTVNLGTDETVVSSDDVSSTGTVYSGTSGSSRGTYIGKSTGSMKDATTKYKSDESSDKGYYSPGISIYTEEEEEYEDDEERRRRRALARKMQNAQIALETVNNAVNLGRAV